MRTFINKRYYCRFFEFLIFNFTSVSVAALVKIRFKKHLTVLFLRC